MNVDKNKKSFFALKTCVNLTFSRTFWLCELPKHFLWVETWHTRYLLPVWEIAKVERGGSKTAYLYPPLTFPISQRVLKIFYSFLVQIISIFYSGFISNKIFGARASARATRQNILKIPRKKRQKWWKLKIFTFSNTFTAFANAYNQNLFVNSNFG